jgi:hypothetical protein
MLRGGNDIANQNALTEKFKNLLILTIHDWEGFDLPFERFMLKKSPHAVRLNYHALILKIGIRKTQEAIEKIITERRVDHVFFASFGDNYFLPLEFFINLRKRVKLIFWTYDDEVYFEVHHKYLAQTMSAVVTTDYFSVPAYRRLGIPSVLCFSSFPKEFFHPEPQERKIDVSFIGNCDRSGRRDYIQYLRDNGVTVEAYGLGSKNGPVARSDMAGIFSRSKINLNFTRCDFFGWHNLDDAMLLHRVRANKGRPIEIALCRSFCLSEFAPSLPHVFEIGQELDYFVDPASLLEKVRYYLAHDSQREAMAERAYQRASRDYEDEPYLNKVLAELDGILNTPSKHHLPPPSTYRGPRFEETHINLLTSQCLWWFLRGEILLAGEVLPYLFRYGPKTFLVGVIKGVARSFSIFFYHRIWPTPTRLPL